VWAAPGLHVCLLASALAVLGFKCPGEDPQLAPGGADQGGAGGSGAGASGTGASGTGAGGAGASGTGGGGTGPGGAGGSSCDDTSSDPDNCGECGRSCSAFGVVDRLCTNGVCTSTCVGDRVNILKPAPPGMDDGCEALGRRVFVTDGFVLADMGSALSGDAECQSAANAANLGGTWMAWLSDSTTSPATRFAPSNVPYLRLDGTAIATNWVDLTDGTLAAPISVDELGNDLSLSGDGEVWTATSTNGTMGFGDCAEWTSISSALMDYPSVGVLTGTGLDWTDVYLQECSRTNVRLYCFEQ
jgi:hypothetical protein